MKTDIGIMLLRLKSKWGFVDLMSFTSGEWRCADSTDEGLGPARFDFYGYSPLQAVQRAYRTIQRCYPLEEK